MALYLNRGGGPGVLAGVKLIGAFPKTPTRPTPASWVLGAAKQSGGNITAGSSEVLGRNLTAQSYFRFALQRATCKVRSQLPLTNYRRFRTRIARHLRIGYTQSISQTCLSFARGLA